MLYIGTAGYSYKDWIGPFYPDGIKDNMMLEYYAGNFDFVEINSSYYHMPGLNLLNSINRKTPDNFKVAVKLFSGFTHERKSDAAEASKFMYSLSPVIESGKLACLLAQFPYSFHCNTKNLDYLKQIRQWFGGANINIEFRNQGWIKHEVLDMLKKENLGFVCVDEPRLKGLVGRVTAATSEIAYLRMHGRNASKWYAGEGSERYDYNYEIDELMEWVPRLKDLDDNSAMTIVSFNNHPRGKAVQNAKLLSELIGSGKRQI